jgi:hypothetical protein
LVVVGCAGATGVVDTWDVRTKKTLHYDKNNILKNSRNILKIAVFAYQGQ